MITDGLTRALTHAAFRERLDGEFRRARRYRRPLSLVLIDLDYFKLVNDGHGHLAGDTVLRDVAGMILSRVRREESLGRLGGEEFAILLPETELAGAKVLARDLQDRVRARQEGARAIIEVQDHGPGIDPEDARKIFERFYRGRAVRSGGPRGTGIGLSLVKHIARAHGGEVSVRAPDGGGAVFAVTIPVTVIEGAAEV